MNVDLDHYKEVQMQRRLDAWLLRMGVSTWSEYLKVLGRDQPERERFLAYLTINVTAFFRDPKRWQVLRETVLPSLLQAHPSLKASRTSRLRLWSAGCSTGEEAYSLAILLDELSPQTHRDLLATDLDRDCLSRAAAGGPYPAEGIVNVSHARIAAYFHKDHKGYFIDQNLIRRVTFREHNLLADPFESRFDLIICRNVIIYLTEAAKAVVYKKLSDALRVNGVLFLGSTEIIPRPQEYGLQSCGISFYRKT
jgi:chemotaxis protein methyltransferase CheR